MHPVLLYEDVTDSVFVGKRQEESMLDYVIKNGWIVNGKNERPFRGEVAVADGKITEISSSIVVPADFPKERILDAGGGYVTPGFLDIHRHGDWEALRNGDDELLNRQGITTVVNGNCGLSVAPCGVVHREEITDFLSSVAGRPTNQAEAAESMTGYMKCLRDTKRSVNTGMLAGNGTIRAAVKGYASGRLGEEEYHLVWEKLEEALSAGALGVSLGIAYAPEFEYDTAGLIRALAPLQGTKVPLVTHVRNEGDGLIPALEEVITVAKALQVPLHVSHLKCIGKRNWGDRPREVLALFDRAREEGVQVDFDLYPYLVGSTQLVHVLPPAFQQGGISEIMKRLADPSGRKVLTKALQTPSDEFENIVELDGFDNIWAGTLRTEEYRPLEGKTIAEIAEARGEDPYEALYTLLLAEKCGVTMLDTVAKEEDMLLFLKDDRANLISDAIYPDGGKYHPRVYGAFPKLLIDYVRERPIFSIEEAIYKMTKKAADVLGIDRGILEEGKAADINVFHLENLRVRADFENPFQFSEGFDYVLTGGKIALEKEKWVNTAGGMVL